MGMWRTLLIAPLAMPLLVSPGPTVAQTMRPAQERPPVELEPKRKEVPRVKKLPPPPAGQKATTKPAAQAQGDTGEACAPMPPPARALPWEPGEKLAFDLDVLGAQAGKLSLVALPPIGKGQSQELSFRALAASNSFFSKIRKVRGRSTSYVRARDMKPRRYREDSKEGKLTRGADVVFKRPNEGRFAQVDFTRNHVKGNAKLPYLHDAFDPLSVVYYLRTLEFTQDMPLCFDTYAIRKLWRVRGKVKGLETVKVPAGVFEAWHIEGEAVRTDKPDSKREIHIWISNDERRLPLAALGVIDLGPVRAQLTNVGKGSSDESEEQLAEEAESAAKGP